MTQGYLDIYNGRMSGVLRWPQLESLWQGLKAEQGWYLYEVGADLPKHKITRIDLECAITEMDRFLRDEHPEKYCGVVYTDNLQDPSMIKVYHPKKMGASCGSSGSTVLPRWTLSRQPPVDLVEWALKRDRKPVWWKHMLKPGKRDL